MIQYVIRFFFNYHAKKTVCKQVAQQHAINDLVFNGTFSFKPSYCPLA